MDERVSFTRPSAERIARVVRAVEGARTPADGIQSRRPPTDARMPKLFRVATYTGAWPIGALKTVVFKNQTATPNTATVLNLFYPVTSTAAGSRDCGIAKEGTAWYLIDVRMATATAVFVRSTSTAITVSSTQSTSVVRDVTLSATLNTDSCAITLGKTLVTSAITVVGATATAINVTGVYTSLFLTIDG